MDKTLREILYHWQEAVPEDRLAHLVRDAARAYSRALQVRLAERDISFGHWTFLRIMWAEDGFTQKEMSDQAGVMESTTFAAIKAMEAKGYIERRKHPSNQKNIHIYLTSKGRALERQLVPLAEHMNAVATRSVSKDHLVVVRKTLLKIIENLAFDEPADAIPLRKRRPKRD
jgi:MarR family transcriptional regulator, organic hydroperoxide resistance regulator